jgi:hypothetical protein
MKVPTKGKIQNRLHLDGEKAALVRRALLKVEEPIEKSVVKRALEEVNPLLGGFGVARCASLIYVRRDLSTRTTLLFDLDTHRWLIECSMLAMLNASFRIRRALQRAAAEAYEREVIETEMQELLIGEGKRIRLAPRMD